MMWLYAGLWAGAMVCMGTGAYVARENGRSPAEGMILGVLLGPFGVLAVAMLPTGRAGPPPVPRAFRGADRDEPERVDVAGWDTGSRGPFDLRP